MPMSNQPDTDPPAILAGVPPRYRRRARRLALLLLLGMGAVAAGGCGPLRGVLPSRHQGPRTIRVTDAAALDRAERLARPGDTVLVAAGTYRAMLDARVSGTRAAPIRFVAAPGVTLDAARGASGISVIGQHDLEFSGFTVTGATAQGIWVGFAQRVRFSQVRVLRNHAPGIQVKQAIGVTIDHSVIDGNLRAGIMELDGVRGDRYLADAITGNGHDRLPFNGDGILLHGQGSVVSDCDVSGNGDDLLHEHGIYVGGDATGYLLEGNDLNGNSAAGIKAEGSGSIRGNRIGSSRLAIDTEDSSGDGILVQGNTITGRFQHVVLVGEHAQVRLWDNTVAASPSPTFGDHSPVLVIAGAALTTRGNHVVWGGRAWSSSFGLPEPS